MPNEYFVVVVILQRCAGCSVEEKVLLQRVTSGNALMVQVNSRVITGVTAVKGRAGSTLSRFEGWSGGGAVQRCWWGVCEKMYCISMKAEEEEVRECVEITAVMVVHGGSRRKVYLSHWMSSIVGVPACCPARRCASEDRGGDRGGIWQSATLSLNLHPQLLPTDTPALLLLPSLSQSLWSHLKCHSIDTVRK